MGHTDAARFRRSYVTLPLLLLSAACGLMGTALSMKRTSIPANDSAWGKLDAEAKKLGWTTKRGSGNSNWEFEAFPAEGQRLMFTAPAGESAIAFNCEGGPLDSSDACVEAANKLFEPAFHQKFSK